MLKHTSTDFAESCQKRLFCRVAIT